MVISLCTTHKHLKMSKEKKNRGPAPLYREDRKLLSNLSNISSKAMEVAKMISWKKADEIDEEAVWKKSIIMGEKCRPLDFSGRILYDSDGNQLPELPPGTARGGDGQGMDHMLLEPLDRMKKADARLNLTQGVLEGVGEELGVLPGMDSFFSALTLQKLVNFLPSERSLARTEFDMIVYDGIGSEETLRLIGAAERVRWYLKYIRNMAEKTDIGRLTAPSFLKLAYESIRLTGGSSEGKSSTEIWNNIEQTLEKASSSFSDSSKFRCYLVMDSSRSASVRSALRYWGCAIQAGTQITGALGFAPQSSLGADIADKFSPLSFALVPYLSTDSSVDWDATINSLGKKTKDLLGATTESLRSSVSFDPSQKTVTLFMPGFDKSEIKLYQYRGGSELLVEAGDQRRIIQLPQGMKRCNVFLSSYRIQSLDIILFVTFCPE
ncbi:hypothetical protein COCNU_13G001120 [Cocos nucifera]|uniref:Uncharacterized protein n=1 Tax=Cocos nucifera TaxID=13894 RepID=A0A8K0ISB3_COCNU|nr:hypothetical protein COCNU_13G001120 [Cocos nucifera]